MRKFVLSAAALTIVAGLMVPAQAEVNLNPGPVKNGTMCWKDQVGRKAEFGYWIACPQTASVAVAPKQRHRRQASR
jgi:hypothetical protein